MELCFVISVFKKIKCSVRLYRLSGCEFGSIELSDQIQFYSDRCNNGWLVLQNSTSYLPCRSLNMVETVIWQFGPQYTTALVNAPSSCLYGGMDRISFILSVTILEVIMLNWHTIQSNDMYVHGNNCLVFVLITTVITYEHDIDYSFLTTILYELEHTRCNVCRSSLASFFMPVTDRGWLLESNTTVCFGLMFLCSYDIEYGSMLLTDWVCLRALRVIHDSGGAVPPAFMIATDRVWMRALYNDCVMSTVSMFWTDWVCLQALKVLNDGGGVMSDVFRLSTDWFW